MANIMTDQDEERWCAEQRANVIAYLLREKCPSATVGEWPAWHTAPILSVWAVESVKQPGWVGWWAISGDCPTDYTECRGLRHPRQGLRDIGLRWQNAAQKWQNGKLVESWQLGDDGCKTELATMLGARAQMMLEIADDEANWDA